MFVRSCRSLALVAALALPQQGCIGSFALTHTLFSWNQGLGDIVGQEAVFLGLVVVQAYTVTLFVDAIALNLIEFITGDNPVARADRPPTEQRTAELGAGTTLSIERRGGEIRTVLDDHGVQTVRVFQRLRGGWVAWDGAGMLVASAFPAGDGAEVRDGSGTLVAALGPREFAAAVGQWASPADREAGFAAN